MTGTRDHDPAAPDRIFAAVVPADHTTPHGRTLTETIERLEGVGDAKLRRILDRYHSLHQLADADIDDLTVIRGIGPTVARRIITAAQHHATTAPTDQDTPTTRHERPDGTAAPCIACTALPAHSVGHPPQPLCDSCDTGHSAAGPHGYATAIQRGCRCQTCLTRLATARAWVNDRNAGASLQQIGERHDLSRQRIHQVTDMLEPSRPWDAIARVDRAERDLHAHIAATHGPPCATCGGDIVGQPHRRYCSHTCAHHAEMLRVHTDEQRRQRQRAHIARWQLANSTDPVARRSARRVLDGTAERRGRWLIEGSAAFNAAVEAVTNDWPLADELPDELRAQVERHLGLREPAWASELTRDNLQHLYVDRHMAPSHIAQKLNCPLDVVYQALAGHDIELRPRPATSSPQYDDILTADYLQREYVERGRSGPDIAAEIGCSPAPVYAALQRHGIERRPAAHRRHR